MMETLLFSASGMLASLGPALPILADAAVKGAVIIAMAALVTHFLRERSAAARHLVWSAALMAQVALPALGLLLPEWRVPLMAMPEWMDSSRALPVDGPRGDPIGREVSPQSGGTLGGGTVRLSEQPDAIFDAGGAPSSTSAISTNAARSATETQIAPPATPAASTHTADVSWLALLWLAGALAVLVRLAIGTASVAKLARTGDRVEDGAWLSLAQRLAKRMGIARPLTLLRGERLGVPVTWGVVYPVVLLPAEADEWPEERRQFVLVHEMAHVKRFDALTQLVAQLTLALFWFSPLVWLAVRRMRAEREHACDDYVLREGTRPSLYANELLDMVRSLGTERHEAAAPAFAALAMARRSEFEGRMLAILDPRADRHTLGNGSLAVVSIVVALLVMPLAAMRPFAARVISEPATGTSAATDSMSAPPRGVAVQERAALDPREPSLTPDGTLAAVASSALTQRSRSCATVSLDKSGDTRSITSNSNDGRTTVEYFWHTQGRCVHASSNGELKFTDDDADFAPLAPGQAIYLRERRPGIDRELSITRSGNSTVRRYSENGREVEWSARGEAWLAALLPTIIRDSGYDAKGRTARIRNRGGVAAVLDEIGLMRSTGAKRKYYEALLAQGNLSDAELDRAVRQAGRDLARSSGDLSAVLRQVPTQRIAPAVEDAVGNVRSDGDRRSVLTNYMQQSPDRELMLTVLRATAGMTSSGDKAAVLVRAAPASMLATDDTLRSAYFRAARGITSDGDRSRVALAALEHGGASDDVVREVVRVVRLINSDGDRRRVLIGALNSSGMRPAVVQQVISATKVISSSGDRAAVLIAVVNRNLLTTADSRTEFVSAARAISSDSDFRRVMDALLRSTGDTIRQ